MGTSKGYIYEFHGRHPAHSSPFSQANILISPDCHAFLADFSLITMALDQSTFKSSCVEGGTIRWMSPELIDPENFGLKKIRPTKESDCYALGMVIHKVLSGQAPFTPWGTPLVIRKVMDGVRPERPEGEGGTLFTDDIWRTLELCWKHQASERISAKDVLPCLEGIPSPPFPNTGGIMEAGADERSDVTASSSSVFPSFLLKSQAHFQLSLWYWQQVCRLRAAKVDPKHHRIVRRDVLMGWHVMPRKCSMLSLDFLADFAKLDELRCVRLG